MGQAGQGQTFSEIILLLSVSCVSLACCYFSFSPTLFFFSSLMATSKREINEGQKQKTEKKEKLAALW